MKFDIIVFPAVVTVAFMINFWFGLFISIVNLTAVAAYLGPNYIRWNSYFKIHSSLFCTYLVSKFIVSSISLLIKND